MKVFNSYLRILHIWSKKFLKKNNLQVTLKERYVYLQNVKLSQSNLPVIFYCHLLQGVLVKETF